MMNSHFRNPLWGGLYVCALLASSIAQGASINWNTGPQDVIVVRDDLTANGLLGPQVSNVTDFDAGTPSIGAVASVANTRVASDAFGTPTAVASSLLGGTTNLNLVNTGAGTPSKSVVTPQAGLFYVEGQILAGTTGDYSSNGYVYSSDNATTGTNNPWDFTIDPTGSENIGDPISLTFSAALAGQTISSGAGHVATATWNIALNGGNIINNSATSVAGATTPFSDSGTVTLNTTIGSTHTLNFYVALTADGNPGVAGNSRSEIFISSGNEVIEGFDDLPSFSGLLIELAAPVPVPASAWMGLSCLALIAGTKMRRFARR